MNIFEIDLRKHIPEVIEIYSEIFGRENKKQIAEKINSAYYVYYLTAEGHENINTSEINKKILQPLYDMYRKEILEVMLTGDRQKFIEKIGTENFEEINDILNKVDYLVYEGLMKSLKKKEREKNKKENANVKEYREQLKRLRKVYARVNRGKNKTTIKASEELKER